jgi:hypothetical protein
MPATATLATPPVDCVADGSATVGIGSPAKVTLGWLGAVDELVRADGDGDGDGDRDRDDTDVGVGVGVGVGSDESPESSEVSDVVVADCGGGDGKVIVLCKVTVTSSAVPPCE